ncbi:MAG: cytochrome c family protein [Magnetococcales bacterium]|nr:cytochrome c family protein [Magnetococcales bacterium]NGZ04978.1 cytochrome c family protein [Magnetococcales bacterium]
MAMLRKLGVALGWMGMLMISGTLWASDTPPAESERPPLKHVPSANCGECHQEIYAQWQGSMHAKSTALTDPIHGAVYRMEAGDPSEEGVTHKVTGTFPVCLQCHAPIAARDKTTKLDAKPMYSEGVNCVACHTMTAFKGVLNEEGKPQLGAGAYEYSKDSLIGPEGAFNGKQPVVAPGGGKEPKVNAFPHRAKSELFKSSDICLGCHQLMVNPQKVPVCTIGDQLLGKEVVETKVKGKVVKESREVVAPTCQSCHMPVLNGFASHEILGGHDPEKVRKSIALNVGAKESGGKVEATVILKNTLLHTMPSSAPFRNLVLKVTALNDKGEVIWSNFKENPDKEDPQAFMILKLLNNDNQPVMPPQATKLGPDSRLKPGERRVLNYAIPAAGVKTVRAELFYNLITRPMAEKIGDKLPEDLKKPALVGRSEAVL